MSVANSFAFADRAPGAPGGAWRGFGMMTTIITTTLAGGGG